jgi:hypothetical protein
VAQIGISNGINRFGAPNPPNRSAPAGANTVTSSPDDTPWWEAGPLWVLVFLVVGYILVFQTLRR